MQETCTAKMISIGWTDLQNPGGGPDPRDYETQDEGLEADDICELPTEGLF